LGLALRRSQVSLDVLANVELFVGGRGPEVVAHDRLRLALRLALVIPKETRLFDE
jgi:hypothetical protein